MHFLITGVAGFIGATTALRLLEDGHSVVGVDSLDGHYSVALKRMRLSRLHARPEFVFHQLDLAEPGSLLHLPEASRIDRVIHLAAQAGVRRSMADPHPYVSSNIVGHLTVLEFCRRMPRKPDLVYASSSSVYGDSVAETQNEDDLCGEPASLYAVTKRTDEMMSQAYADLYGVNQTGLRLFTVYGPWGRPDMAYWLFTSKALRDEPIDLFNHGNMARDFTYIDDAVDGLVRVATKSDWSSGANTGHHIFNLGTGWTETLGALVEAVQAATGRTIQINTRPMQAGDVHRSRADITRISEQFGYLPTVGLAEGVRRFVDWFMSDPDLALI
ncbi:MAG: NAD-dependent epimerase/dehydratase family protein [Pseudomonadota bacterium]